MYFGPKQYLKQDKRLRSTRHKKWLLNPSLLLSTPNKQVTFQITKPDSEKREVTMVKNDKLDSKKRSGISPFLYTPEVWPEDAATQNIETTENGNKLKSKMRVLEGDEVPEKLMIWLKDFEDRIFKNVSLSAPVKLTFLRRLVDAEAQTILSQVELNYKNNYVNPSDVPLLTDYIVQGEILTKYTTDAQVQICFDDTAGDAACKKLRVEHIIRKASHRIKIQVFGNERFGLQSFIQLKRTMTAMKIGPNCDIKTWSKRFNTFQEFLPRCLWITGAKDDKWPEAYDEERKREILKFALSKKYQSKLNSEGWCLSENTYDKSIGKIKEVELEILRMLKEREDKRENAKEILELQQKAGLRKNSSKKFGKTGKYNKDKNQSTPKPDGSKDANGYYLYGNCEKTHKRVCRKPVQGTTTNQNNTPRKEWMDDKESYL